MWTKQAVGSDKQAFKNEVDQSNRALKAATTAMAPIFRNPTGKFSKTQLRQMATGVAKAYRRSTRAQEKVMISKGRMTVGAAKTKIPHGINSRKAIVKAVKKAKHAKAKVVRKAVRKMRRVAKRAAKLRWVHFI